MARCGALALLLALFTRTEGAAAPALGQDKALHVFLGASSALLACAALSPCLITGDEAGEDARAALASSLQLAAAGLGTALLSGVMKEVLDLAGYGNPEWLDLAATLAGGLAASACVLTASYLTRGQTAEQLPIVYASFGVVLALPLAERVLERKRELKLRRRSSASSGGSNVPSTPPCTPCPVLPGCSCGAG